MVRCDSTVYYKELNTHASASPVVQSFHPGLSNYIIYIRGNYTKAGLWRGKQERKDLPRTDPLHFQFFQHFLGAFCCFVLYRQVVSHSLSRGWPQKKFTLPEVRKFYAKYAKFTQNTQNICVRRPKWWVVNPLVCAFFSKEHITINENDE